MTKLSRILIIDDEKDLVMILKKKLIENGHDVIVGFDGEEGIEKSKLNPDLILLDIMMPKIDGFEVCKTIRDNVICPIIFLSAKQSETDKIRGLNLGGDDYIIKPFGLRELLAKIEANLRREKRIKNQKNSDLENRIYFGKLSLNIKERVVKILDEEIPLTKTEYEIVELLALNTGQIFTKEQIYEKVWGFDKNGDNTTVVERIKKIRKKFSKVENNEQYISTVWGIGYKWNKSGE